MAYGNELILGFPFAQWDKLTDVKLPNYVIQPASRLALPWEPEEGEDPEELDPSGDDSTGSVRDAFEPVLGEFDAALRKAHHAALLELGFTPKKGKKKNDNRLDYPIFNTPEGEREFSPFDLELFYDPGEMGDNAEDAVIGVAISGRYFPTFADWKDAHGCVPMIFDAEMQRIMEIAKRHITGVLPCLQEAPWMVLMIHY